MDGGSSSGTRRGKCVEKALMPLDELQGKMRRNNPQGQQPTMTRAACQRPLRPAREGAHDHRIGVHDRSDWPFTITGMRSAELVLESPTIRRQLGSNSFVGWSRTTPT